MGLPSKLIVKNLNFHKFNMAAAAVLKRPPFWKTVTSRYLHNLLTDFHEIWHGDAYGHPGLHWALKIALLKIRNSARPPCWKIAIMCLKGLMVMHIASLPIPTILRNKTANIIKTKLESVSLSCKSHRSKMANIKMLFATSKHRSKLPHLYQSQACHYACAYNLLITFWYLLF